MVLLMGADLFRELTPWQKLIDALESAFRQPNHVPDRLHFDLGTTLENSGVLLVMPAWQPGGLLGVKVVQSFPGNSLIGKPTIDGIYMLASASTGEVYSLIDAQELTARRTAAVSALASRFLSRPASECLLIVGTGRLAFDVIAAHASIRPIDRVLIWGRDPKKAERLVERVRSELGRHAEAVGELSDAVPQADIISTITAARHPILLGRYITPGTHVDLIGGFTANMREADDAVVQSAAIYVDQLDSALREAGDIADPLARGVIDRAAIRGDLFGLCSGRVPSRCSDTEITLFKSVGFALEDLAAAILAWNTLRGRQPETLSAV